MESLKTLINSGYPDIRRIINSAQRQVVNHELKIDEMELLKNDYKIELLKILKTQDKKNAFKNIRQLLADSEIKDYADLYRLMYDEVDSYAKGHVAEVILILAKYEHMDTTVPDKEINTMAMIIEVLGVTK